MIRRSQQLVLLAVLMLMQPCAAENFVELFFPQEVLTKDESGQALPGRAQARSSTAPQVYLIDWDNYLTVIAIDESRGMRDRCYVATLEKETRALAVAYPGMAFLDAKGVLHVDSRGVHITGPQAHQWSPDSFAITADGGVRVIDDANRGNPGRVADHFKPAQASKQYHHWLALARSYVLARF